MERTIMGPREREINIRVTEDQLDRLLPEIFDLLNPDDWWYLETELKCTKANVSKGTRLCFSNHGFSRRHEDLHFRISLSFEDFHGVFEIFAGNLPEEIIICEGNFRQVYNFTRSFFSWGYKLVYLKARTGWGDCGLPETSLKMSFPKETCFYYPALQILMRKAGSDDYSFIAGTIIDYLKMAGYLKEIDDQ